MMPNEVLDELFSRFPLKEPKILDLGCGTGIVTRQLAERGALVTGVDIDSRMIRQAQRQGAGNIEYFVAPAEKLPLPDSIFDAVTAFSAFHWFANGEALSEIKRVLKAGGMFFVANRNKTGEVRKEYLNVIRSFIDGPLPDVKKDYKPSSLMKSAGLVDVEEKTLSITESFTLEQALLNVKSTSHWNLIPDNKKQEALKTLETFFRKYLRNNQVARPVEIQTVTGQKR